MKPRIIELPKIEDPRGNLTFLQHPDHLPFPIRRVFWTYDVPGGETRGGHAYYTQKEFVIALSGSFDVVVRNVDGSVNTFQMNRSYYGLYLPALTWRHMENFSTNALSVHVSDAKYEEGDYIREWDAYRDQVV